MDFLIGLLNVVIILGSLFLICIILIQRGKGGGLAGAFGGVGGSSAFGTKAGDVFTRITIGVAAGWIVTAMLLVVLTNNQAGSAGSGWGNDATSTSKELSPSKSKTTAKDKGKSPAADTADALKDLPTAIPTDIGNTAPSVPPPVNIPAIPDTSSKPATTAPTTAPAPAPSGAAPAKSASKP